MYRGLGTISTFQCNEFVVPEETIKSVTSLEELVKLLLANPAKSWPLFRNFILYPDEIKSSNRPTFRAVNDRQPQKLFVVKLSGKRRDLVLIESCLDDEKRCHLVVECVDWGEWNVAGYKCYAIIMERDTKNMSLFSQTQPTALSTQSANCLPPCLWKLQGATTYPLPRGKLFHKMSLRLLFCCEVRDDSSCEYFPHDDVIQVEAQSTFIRDALPILKMSYLLLKAIALIRDYDICIGPDYNFDVRESAPDERLLTALEAIHGQVTTPRRLNKIVQELESGDLNDDQVDNYANEIYGIIDDHRERNRSEMLNLLQSAGLNIQSDVISGLKKHALISRYVCNKHSELVEDGVLNLRRDPPLHLGTGSICSLSLATKYVHKALENMVDSTSEIIVTARAIFDLALKCEVHRQSVLATALMVERIVRKGQTLEGLEHPQTLLEALRDVKSHFETNVLTTNVSKLLFGNSTQQSKLPIVASDIEQLQDRLLVAVEHLTIDLTLSVEGHIEDLQKPIGNLVDKMNSIDKTLELIGELPNPRHQKDKLIELAIQIQRGFEFYQHQVVLGNISTLHDFENQIQLIQKKICNVVDRLKAGKHLPKAFSLDEIESWMLSSDDVTFNSSDLSTFLGRGMFATVYKGMYQGQPVAVKVFEQILQTDSADLERFIAKEMSAWKGISHEPYILTLVGVCTKVPTPILVCELCQANIRNYVNEKPDSLIPLVYQVACGLASLHHTNIIHRDIKGDNILITFSETVAFSDFGMNRAVTSIENTKTRVTWTGKLNWTSPELYFKPRKVTEKSDVWSFGMTLWEVISNAVPFEGCDENAFRNDIYKSENVRPQKPDNLNPEHEPLWTLMTMCWQLNPSSRPSSAEIVNFMENHFNAYL
ncbi:hypothetical protein LEN26_002633 [Aphanomyces euteiches]|nr:hypothetical protein LEN26_002633 [Aphanomyces euteiches]